MRRRTTSAGPRVERAGKWLHEAHRAGARFAPLPDELAPRSVADAYAIQAEYAGLRAAESGAVVGYKVGLTTPAMRSMVGISEPVAGDLLERTIRRSPANVLADDFSHLVVEFEIAVLLGEDLPAVRAPYTRAQVAEAVAAVMPALELLDDRHADYGALGSHPLMLIADNAWNEGAVLGEPVRDWRKLDLAAVRGVARVNGRPTGEGLGADVMGHPFEALAWLANNLASRGLGLWRSDVVMTGSLVTTYVPGSGDRVSFELGPLGAVELRVD